MDWNAIIHEIIFGGGKTILIITCILMPLIMLMELIRDSNLLERSAGLLRPVMRVFRLPKQSALPLLAGVFVGITFGSGVIIPMSQKGDLSIRDMTLIGTFLAVCHGMIEDPLVFSALGASWWIIIGVRVFLAVVIMLVLSRVLKNKPIPVIVENQ